MRILDARWSPTAPTPLRAGELAVIGGGLWCGAGRGALVLEVVQPSGRRAMHGADWARGVRGGLGWLSGVRSSES